VYGTAVVEVVDPTEGTRSHPITDQGITVQSPSAYVIQGKTRQFTQTGAASVKWFVYGNSETGTTINGNGLLEADAGEQVGTTLTVWAISTTGNSAYGTAQVTVRAPVTLESTKTVTVSGLKSDSTWWNGIAYDEDVFVAGSFDGKIFRSEDRGESWTQVANSRFSSFITSIAYGGDVFVAVGNSGKIAYSTDAGATWTAVTSSPFGSTTIASVRYLEGKFFAVGNDNKMAYSDDGIAWTSAAGGFGINYIRDIAYGAGKFVTVGFTDTRISWSSNGIDNWTTVSGLGNVFPDNLITIIYADRKFVAGSAGNGSNVGNLGYSVSGDSGWTLGGSLGSGKTVRSIAYGDGKFIAVSYGNRIAYSGDGIDWDYLDTTSPCNGVAYGDGRFVIVQDGKVLIIGD
jgi:hypothetical protein